MIKFIGKIIADRLFSSLVILVLSVAIGFAVFLGADIKIVAAIVVVGVVAAFAESSHHRNKK